MKNLNKVKRILTSFKPQLMQSYPIASIGLLGPIVFDDFNANSDINIIVEFNGTIGIEFITLADELENKLNWKVNLISKLGIKPQYLKVIEKEIIYV